MIVFQILNEIILIILFGLLSIPDSKIKLNKYLKRNSIKSVLKINLKIILFNFTGLNDSCRRA